MSQFADYRDIDAQINSVLNRSATGVFSAVGDTSDSADQRYSDALVTECRRKAAYRIFEAIGSNPSHPFWAELMEYVLVAHDETIPVHYGEIGLPIINPFSNSTFAHGSLLVGRSAIKATGTLVVVNAAATYATGYLAVQDTTARATGSLTIIQGAAASGTITVAAQPTNGETLNVNGAVFTFTTLSAGILDIEIGSDIHDTAVRIADALNASTNPLISVATYTAGAAERSDSSGSELSPSPSPPTVVTITYDSYGTAGNAFALHNSSGSHIVATAANLSGGVNGLVEGETLNINGVAFIFHADVPTFGDPGARPIPITFYDSAASTTTNLATVLNNSTNPLLTGATYTAVGNAVLISYDTIGYIGNTYTLFVSSSGAVTRSGSTLTGGLGGVLEGEVIEINGVIFTFSNRNVGSTFIPFSSDSQYTATQLAAVLNASASGAISVAAYSYLAPDRPSPATEQRVTITYKTAGVGGNSFVLFNSEHSNVTRSGSSLTGGTAGLTNGETININGVTFTFNGTGAGANEIQIGGSINATATNIANKLNAHANALISAATYTASTNTVSISYDTFGTIGNAYTTTTSSLYSVRAAELTLTGGLNGIIENETLAVNTVVFTFKASPTLDSQIQFGASAATNAINVATALTDSTDPLLTIADYAVDANTVNVTSNVSGTAGNAFVLANSSGSGVTRTAMSGGQAAGENYSTGYGADPDDIDSMRSNTIGLETDFFGTGRVNHDQSIGNGLPSPVAGRYSTANGVFKFTGYSAKIPMIRVPADSSADDVVLVGTDCETTFNSSFIENVAEALDAQYLGRLAVILDDTTEIGRGAVTEVVDSTTFSIAPEVVSATAAHATFTFYNVASSDAQVMADTKIPIDLSTLNVKLAVALACKEGDNNLRVMQWLGSEGERDLIMLKNGAVKVAPINLEKMTQLGQQFTM